MIITISFLGNTNVGKSTLFNLVTQSNDSLIVDLPGTTRDIIYGKFIYKDLKSVICDMPGINFKEDILNDKILNKIYDFISISDIILFIVDFSKGITKIEKQISHLMIKFNKKPVILVINKVDKYSIFNLSDFYKLGIKKKFPISAKYNLGLKVLYEEIYRISKKNDFVISQKTSEINNIYNLNINFIKKIKVAIVGNLNVGKSTFINKLIEKDRVLVQNANGTTRDPIFIHHLKNKSKYILVDTAGIRKQNKTKKLMEHLSIIKSLKTINISHVVVLVIDVTKSIRKQDLSLINYIYKAGKSLIILFNKSDLLKIEEKKMFYQSIKRLLYLYKKIKYFFISALKDKNLNFLWKQVDSLYSLSIKNISVKKINFLLKKAKEKRPPPLILGKKQVKLKYAHIGGKNPLIIIIHGYQTKYINKLYIRYLENFFYNHLFLDGIRVEIQFKENKLIKKKI